MGEFPPCLLGRGTYIGICSKSSKIGLVSTYVGSTVDLDPQPSGGTPVVSNGRGRLSLPFLSLAANGRYGGVPGVSHSADSLLSKIEKRSLQKG